MFGGFFGSKKEGKLDLQSTIDAIIASPSADLYSSLIDFIPENSKQILDNLLNGMVTILIRPTTDQKMQKAIIDILYRMIYDAEMNDPNSPIFQILKENVGLPNSLMLHVFPLDEQVIFIIEKLFIKYPNIFLDFILEHPYSAEQMIQVVAVTKNKDAANLFQRISVSRPEVLEKLRPMIAKRIKEFPISTTVDFMIASPQLQNIIPEDEIESWLITHEQYTISDVHSILKFYPSIWNTETCLILLSRTTPSPGTKQITWIHSQPPQELKLSSTDAIVVAASLNEPRYPFTILTDKSIIVHDACESYAYVRLFALSFADPSDLDSTTIEEITSLCTDKHEFIAAGAVQTIIIWILKYNFKVKSSFVYKTAGAIFEEERTEELTYLFRAFLRVLGMLFDSAVALSNVESSLVYKEAFVSKILDAKWCYPHFKPFLEEVQKLKLVDLSESLNVLGYFVKFLGLDESSIENQ